MTLASRYRKKFWPGGQMSPDQVDRATNSAGETMQALSSTAASAAAGLVPGGQAIYGLTNSIGGGLIDAIDKPDAYGKQSLLGSYLKGSMKGGFIGGIGAILSQGGIKDMEAQMERDKGLEQTRKNSADLAAKLSTNPNLLHGNMGASYYAAGGSLASKFMNQDNVASQTVQGGEAEPISSTASQFNGPSHEEGGIQIPGAEAEVEGNESAENGYVFSDRLGFAKPHKALAKSIGKIEQKAMSPERITSLKLLRGQINTLRQQQEFVKQQLNLQ